MNCKLVITSCFNFALLIQSSTMEESLVQNRKSSNLYSMFHMQTFSRKVSLNYNSLITLGGDHRLLDKRHGGQKTWMLKCQLPTDWTQ